MVYEWFYQIPDHDRTDDPHCPVFEPCEDFDPMGVCEDCTYLPDCLEAGCGCIAP